MAIHQYQEQSSGSRLQRFNAEELMKSNWFSGPAFLWEKEIPFSKEEIPNIQIARLRSRNPPASSIAYQDFPAGPRQWEWFHTLRDLSRRTSQRQSPQQYLNDKMLKGTSSKRYNAELSRMKLQV